MFEKKISEQTLKAIVSKAHRTHYSILNGFTQTSLRGYIDNAIVAEIREEFQNIFTLETPLSVWVVDAMEVESYESTAVPLFGELMATLHEHGTTLLIVASTPGSKMGMFFSSIGFSSSLSIKHCSSANEAEDLAREFLEFPESSEDLKK